MEGLSLPLNISAGALGRQSDTAASVSSFLELLIRTAKYTYVPDPEFGFILNNLRFESISETEGIVCRGPVRRPGEDDLIYDKKISGTSSNMETFAYELKNAIELYEKRISGVKVTMTYVRQNKMIHINIKGKLVEDDTDFQFATDVKVWN